METISDKYHTTFWGRNEHICQIMIQKGGPEKKFRYILIKTTSPTQEGANGYYALIKGTDNFEELIDLELIRAHWDSITDTENGIDLDIGDLKLRCARSLPAEQRETIINELIARYLFS
jgi:hypothetical protein